MPPQMPPVVVEIVEGSIEENAAIHAANELRSYDILVILMCACTNLIIVLFL